MKIKISRLFVKPKNISKHINSLISHAFSSKRIHIVSSSSRGKSSGRDELIDEQKARIICREPLSYKSLSFKDYLENKDTDQGRKSKIFKKKRSSRTTGNDEALITPKEGKRSSGRSSSSGTASSRSRKSTRSPKLTRNGEEEEESKSGRIELCKKRILMGERCRPLNVSGCLQYDETGILLPEDIFE